MTIDSSNKYPCICPCCHEGYIESLHDICSICGWEDDEVQNYDENYSGGANKLSLRDYRIEFENKRKMNPLYRWSDHNHKIIGDRSEFAIEYCFHENRYTELAMFVKGINILEYDRDGETCTTCWNLDEIAEWLRIFVDNMNNDPYPVETEGRYASEKDDNAREFDSDDDEEFDRYYDFLDEWCLRHRWHPASSGGILADVYFQAVDDKVEISWNNRDMEEYITYRCDFGGDSVDKLVFYEVVDSFLKEYAKHWF